MKISGRTDNSVRLAAIGVEVKPSHVVVACAGAAQNRGAFWRNGLQELALTLVRMLTWGRTPLVSQRSPTRRQIRAARPGDAAAPDTLGEVIPFPQRSQRAK
jgi:hypothetical protein